MLRFDGAIAGLGTASGTRIVVGMWPLSPFGPVTDVMVQRPDGHRILLAPTEEFAGFIRSMYEFDEVRVEPVLRMRDGRTWMISSDDLALTFEVGGRPPVGLALLAVPRTVARSRWWAGAVSPIARMAMHGIRTRGRTTDGRREWYCAQDLRHIVAADARFDGHDLGELRPVDPPVGFGFSSVPPRPSLVRVLTQIAD
ncbi:hypothetical protein [Nakamurella sp.]|uniref:hypothetical protein n=1 Tax=Nakamurella sp. TaxID=1869182 RepID=UPI0037833170